MPDVHQGSLAETLALEFFRFMVFSIRLRKRTWYSGRDYTNNFPLEYVSAIRQSSLAGATAKIMTCVHPGIESGYSACHEAMTVWPRSVIPWHLKNLLSPRIRHETLSIHEILAVLARALQ